MTKKIVFQKTPPGHFRVLMGIWRGVTVSILMRGSGREGGGSQSTSAANTDMTI
jgi:hypothetical protein